MHILNNKYKFIERIGSGSFGYIYKGQNIRTNEYVAIKIEPIKNKLNLLKNESKIYQYLNGCDNIPIVKWYGKDETNYYMVINLLGDSLQNLVEANGKLSLKLTLNIGIKIISLIKIIHDKGLVHRDIKPENFLFNLNDKKTIYLIDFGFCKRFLLDDEHIKIKTTSGCIGSKNYMSINSHNHLELSRRDDLESVGYMLLFLHYGFLPWSNEIYDNELINIKKDILNDINLPKCLISYIKYIRSLDFEEKPNYILCMNYFRSEAELLNNMC